VRILVTGSRTWTDSHTIGEALEGQLRLASGLVVIVHGACPRGADAIGSEWVKLREDERLFEEPHPADWRNHTSDCPSWHFDRPICARAGILRNVAMVAAGADLCLAFIRANSRGATHCAGLAEKAGIPVRRYTA
jgi:hypothetical protein